MNEQWFEAFRGDPDQAVSDLFSGRAGVGSYLRLDVPELLYQAFPPTLTDERAQLDRALLSWLKGMREAYPAHVKRLGFPVYAKRVGDALIALQLLELPQARQGIRAELGAWLRWLSTLRLAPDRDPALECFRLLTRDQPETGHTAMWLRLAADPRPEYLTVALAGLQQLPNQDDAQKNQMLMLQWFQAQGHRNAHEWTLREMLRLFPNDDHACVELGRVLIDQGEEHWDEAEHWLQQVLMRSPDSGQSAQRSLDRLRAGMDSTTDDAFDELSDNPIPVALDSPDPPEPLPRALKELFRRGRLGGEFSRARIARTHGRVVPTDFIREETGQGDPLAGFYSQWLMPDETPEGPPHAWAWNACRHWQKLASPDQWRRLAEQFPEAAPETEFLHILAATDNDNQSAAARWRDRYCTDDGSPSRAVDLFMREVQERLTSAGHSERGELAVVVMACTAVDAPDFALERAA